MVNELDWMIGEVIAFLEETDEPRNPGHKLIDNTYIIISSDNGGLVRPNSLRLLRETDRVNEGFVQLTKSRSSSPLEIGSEYTVFKATAGKLGIGTGQGHQTSIVVDQLPEGGLPITIVGEDIIDTLFLSRNEMEALSFVSKVLTRYVTGNRYSDSKHYPLSYFNLEDTNRNVININHLGKCLVGNSDFAVEMITYNGYTLTSLASKKTPYIVLPNSMSEGMLYLGFYGSDFMSHTYSDTWSRGCFGITELVFIEHR